MSRAILIALAGAAGCKMLIPHFDFLMNYPVPEEGADESDDAAVGGRLDRKIFPRSFVDNVHKRPADTRRPMVQVANFQSVGRLDCLLRGAS
jgi:hypothetical protein